MLILGRKVGQRIYIGDDIVLTLVEARGMFARIGVDAPKEVPVHREEVYHAIRRREDGGDATHHPPIHAEG